MDLTDLLKVLFDLGKGITITTKVPIGNKVYVVTVTVEEEGSK